jgi:competence protein ComEA
MPTSQERTALIFLAGIALVAVGVRVVGVQRFDAEVAAASGGQGPDSSLAVRALAAQVAAVDSARSAPRRSKSGRPRTPSSRAARAPKLPATKALAPRLPIDVNAATAAELERLPRVGPALAKRIIEWRETHGPFKNAEDLRHVRGIGPSTVRLLDSLVTFSGRHSPLGGEGSPSPAHHFRSVY